MATVTRLAQFKDGTTRHHFAAVRQEAFEHLLQVQQARLAVDQRHHVHAEGVLQLRHLVQIVQDDVGDLATLELNHDPHTGLIRLIADFRNAFNLLFVDQLGNLLEQGALIHLIRQLVDDDRLAVAGFIQIFEMGLGTHHHTTAAGTVTVAHTGNAIDNAGGREIRCRHDVNQLINGQIRVVEQGQTGCHDFREVMRRNIGRHAHGDPRRTVNEQVRDTRRQNQWFFFRTVVVRPKINRFLVNVSQQFMTDARHTDFGITHRRRVITVDRTEVALAIDQHVTQREILRHPDNGVVNGRIPVRVIFTDDVTDHTGRLLIGLVPVVIQLVHRKQHATVHWLQAVAHIRERTSNDHAHGVIQIGTAHLVFEADRECFFGEIVHNAFVTGQKWFEIDAFR